MNKPKDWDNVKASQELERLPAGGYVVEIKKAEIKKSESGYEYLDLSIEISEGEYKDFFSQNYKAQTLEPKKYKGHFRQGVPKDDGSDSDKWTQSNFKSNIENAFEDSNDGFHWAWDEQKLVGLKVGALFRNAEYDYKGNRGFHTECCRLIDANKIRKGDFKTPKDKMLSPSTSSIPEGFQEINDDDIPF
jgi:hypothetical protein